MTLAEHLEELRSRLIKATIGFALAFVALWTFRSEVVHFIRGPFDRAVVWLNEDLVEIYDERVQGGAPADLYFEAGYPDVKVVRESKRVSDELNYFGIGSSMILRLRTCFWLGLFIAGPYALFQAWAFVAAGLYRKERKIVYRYFPTSMALFVAGVGFGFFLLVPYAAYFLSKEGLGEAGGQQTISADEYLQFIKALSLAIGLVFQMPLVQFLLARLGLVDPKLYGKYRGHMAVGTLIVSAILTPPDPVTQLMLAVPALLLYEVGAAVSRLVWTPVPGAVEPSAHTSD